MNSQREVIYTKRRHALFGERLSLDINNMLYDVCESLVFEHHGNSDFDVFNFDLMRILFIESPADEKAFIKINPEELVEQIYQIAYETYSRKVEAVAKQAFPVIKDVFEKQSATYKNIVVPITDGTKTFQIITNLEKATNTEGRELVKDYQKTVILATIDELWKEHLREMDDLRQSVQNASYEQKDPLLIYKLESFDLFKVMVDKINREVVSTLMKGHIPIRDSGEVREARPPRRLDLSDMETGRDVMMPDAQQGGRQHPTQQRVQPVRTEKKVGRNDPCPCGSGKKYKHCHGKVGQKV
jgi:preprotein translocase subunit SecA